MSLNGIPLLFNVPGFCYQVPPLGQAILSASLTEKEIPFQQYDLGIEFYHSFFGGKSLRRLVKKKLEGGGVPFEIDKDDLLALKNSTYSKILNNVTPGSKQKNKLDSYYRSVRLLDYIQSIAVFHYGPIVGATFGVLEDTDIFSSFDLIMEQVEVPFVVKNYVPFLRKMISDIPEPTLLAFTISNPAQLFYALVSIVLLKKRFPGVPVVAGGAFLSLYAKEKSFFNPLKEFFDYIVLFQGEETFRELCGCLNEMDRILRIPNLLYLSGEKYKRTSVRASPHSDECLVPCFDGLPLDKYIAPQITLPVLVSKSCPFKCAFCSYNRNVSGGWHAFKAKNIVGVIEKLQSRYAVSTVFLSSSYVGSRHAIDIARELLRRGVNVSWLSQTRPEKGFAKPGVLKMLKESGCVSLSFGLESASTRVLNLMNKSLDPKEASKVFHLCRDLGIVSIVFFIIGFPGERAEDAKKTASFITRHAGVVDVVSYTWYKLEPYSPVWQDPESYGVVFDRDSVESGSFYVPDYCYRILSRRKTLFSMQKRYLKECASIFEDAGYVASELLGAKKIMLPEHFGWQAYAVRLGSYVFPGWERMSTDAQVRWEGGRARISSDDHLVEIRNMCNSYSLQTDIAPDDYFSDKERVFRIRDSFAELSDIPANLLVDFFEQLRIIGLITMIPEKDIPDEYKEGVDDL